MITIADCHSPKGQYITEVHSGADEYTYLKQEFENKEPYEAIIISDKYGYEPEHKAKVVIGRELICAIKSREFHKIILEPKLRFHRFSEPEAVVLRGVAFTKFMR